MEYFINHPGLDVSQRVKLFNELLTWRFIGSRHRLRNGSGGEQILSESGEFQCIGFVPEKTGRILCPTQAPATSNARTITASRAPKVNKLLKRMNV